MNECPEAPHHQYLRSGADMECYWCHDRKPLPATPLRSPLSCGRGSRDARGAREAQRRERATLLRLRPGRAPEVGASRVHRERRRWFFSRLRHLRQAASRSQINMNVRDKWVLVFICILMGTTAFLGISLFFCGSGHLR